MRLTRARITNYRSIEDSGWVEFGDVTCLVGKNESGKTAFLQALAHLNPISGPSDFEELMDYPSRHYAAYRGRLDKSPAKVVEAEFELDDEEMAAVESEFGKGFLKNRQLSVSRGYGPIAMYATSQAIPVAIRHMTKSLEVPASARARLNEASSFVEVKETLAGVPATESVTAFLGTMAEWRDENVVLHLIDSYLKGWVPKFFYFDDYSIMKGRVSMPYLRERKDAGQLDEADQAFLSLLTMVGAVPEDFENANNFEGLTRELEAAANSVTDQVCTYWTQNRQLEVGFVVSDPDAGALPPLDHGPILHVRVRNNKHRVTVPFDERSRGFVWFFSFFAYFSDLERENPGLILLLDEPGLNLHATAQRDFLRLIDERLAPRHQVIYSTHSPFMVEAGRLDRVRTVQDVGDEGTKVSDDVLGTDGDTRFPLLAALGYDLAQNLFVAPNCLLVEGPSDMLYLQLLTQALRAKSRQGLDDAWVLVPVGGADKLVTFVSLLGSNQVNAAVLMHVSNRERQQSKNLQSDGRLSANAVVRLTEITGTSAADIEDIFTPSFYLELVNGAFSDRLSKKITLRVIGKGNPRIAVLVGNYFKALTAGGEAFSRYPPAAYFLAEQVTLLPKLDDATLDRAEMLFERINGLVQRG